MKSFVQFLLPIWAAAIACGQTTGSENRVIPGTLPTHEAITKQERVKWFMRSSFGPSSLVGGVISAGFGTAFNTPHEYGTHWQGFGQRYGMRLTGVVTSNAMEAGIGAWWGEDPRYFRVGMAEPFSNRVGHVVKWTFLAKDRNGNTVPAYARYIATAGNNFLSNAWREPSESDSAHALERTALGFAARTSANAFKEFWPDVRGMLHHRRFSADR